MERRADARIGVRADDEEPPDAEAGQDRLEGGRLEGVAVVLVDVWLGVVRPELGTICQASLPARTRSP